MPTPSRPTRATISRRECGGLQASIQYGLYALLARTTKGLPIQRFVEHWVPRVSKRTPQPEPEVTEIDVPRAERAATAMVNRIVEDATAFLATEDPESFMPNPQSMLCSARSTARRIRY